MNAVLDILHSEVRRTGLLSALMAGFLATSIHGQALAQSSPVPSLGLYGTTGLLDMPSGESAPDGQLSSTISYFAGSNKNTLTFQITPRLSGSFRYSILNSPTFQTWDRSFDIRYQLLREGRFRPAVAVGLQDFIGTGIYAAEYLAATKHLSPNLKVTGGIGWGRLGSSNGFTNPLSAIFGAGWNTRTAGVGLGGTPTIGAWFRGPAAFFGGVEWQTPIRGLSAKVEYSSDAYTLETVTHSFFTRRSPVNVGLTYQFKNGNQVSAFYMYGSKLGISGSIGFNPNKPPNPGILSPAPLPVYARPKNLTYDSSWTAQADGPAILRGNIQTLLNEDEQVLEALRLTATTAEVRFRNLTQDAVPQAIGRVARALTQVLPNSIETFIIVPVENGMALMTVRLSRSDIEELEHHPDGAAEILKRAVIADSPTRRQDFEYADGVYPKRTWALEPYSAVSLFDPDNPLRIDLGVRLDGKFEVRPGLILSGSVRKRVIGNLNTVTRLSNSVMRHVRSDYGMYDNAGDPAVEHLTAEYFFRPGANVYGRITAGYLEKMYGGVSGELLWSPANKNIAISAELNVVKQRAFNQLFGFQNYSVVTGHVSGYWDMGNGFHTQVDVGRYLAGDYGATFTVDRVFNNGWKVGAFFTLTNVSFATFGEGSFDKGLRFTIPQSWTKGISTRKASVAVMRPITRDGGARLEVRNRLYSMVEDYRGDRLKRRWGRFWR